MVFNDVLEHLRIHYMEFMRWDRRRLTAAQLAIYARAVQGKIGAYGVWGFIDGTMRSFCRPADHEIQQSYYSGHKKAHGFQFQGIITPDGIMSSLYGPFKGPTGDWHMWNVSGLDDELRAVFRRLPNNQHLYLYGDLAYWPAFGVMGPHRDVRGGTEGLTPIQKAANLTMSTARITVEWGFGRNVNLWGINSYKRGSKIMASPVAMYYVASTLLTNLRTCMDGRNQTSDTFQLAPPSVEEYLRSIIHN